MQSFYDQNWTQLPLSLVFLSALPLKLAKSPQSSLAVVVAIFDCCCCLEGGGLREPPVGGGGRRTPVEDTPERDGERERRDHNSYTLPHIHSFSPPPLMCA